MANLFGARGPRLLCHLVFLLALCVSTVSSVWAACTSNAQCDDGIACTADLCQNGQCNHAPNHWKCPDDGLYCNGDEVCSTSYGCVHTGVPCIPGYVCAESTDQCFQCDSNDDCNDNNSCTNNVCSSTSGGWCTYPAKVCSDSNACTADTCSTSNPSGCTYTPISCDDASVCTTDSCNAATGCSHTSVSCNDNNACTVDSCDAATGCTHTPLTCHDNDACTTDTCNPASGCVYSALTCNDGLYCNGTESCNPSVGCVAGANACPSQLCDEAADACFDCAAGGPPTRNGLWFDGSNDYVSIGSPATLEMSGAFTVEAWILPTSNTYGIIVNKESEYQIARFPDGTIRWAVNNNSPGWTWVSTGAVAPLNTWSHVAWTFDYNITQKINTYLNGTLVHSVFEAGPVNNTPSPNDQFRIGNRQIGGNPFGGAIDEVRVWNVARAAAQIQASMNVALTGTEAGLKGYWRLEEGIGATTADLASANTGTLVEAAWAVDGCNDGAFCNGVETCGANRLCNASIIPCSGQLCNESSDQCFGCAAGGPETRKGLRFDGVNDVVTAGASSALQMTTALTLEAWILPTSDVEPGLGGIIAGRDSEFLFARNPNGNLMWLLKTTSPGWSFVTTPAVAPLQAWSHVAFTYDGSNVRTYLNGALASTQAASGPIQPATAPSNQFRIGGRYSTAAGTRYFAGVIDDVSLWNVALPAATIASHATNATIGSTAPNLKGYWRLDEGVGATTADAVLGNTAAIAGALWIVDGCLDTVACTTDTCNAATATCQHSPVNTACDDAVSCTADTCNATLGCLHTPSNAACNDASACTTDTCSVTAGCQHATISCDDAVPCTVDTCSPSSGCQHTADNSYCNDGVACTLDLCDAASDGFCAHVSDDALCSDGVGCNGAETCSLTGGCQPGAPSCDDGNVCTTDVCNVATDQCSHTVNNAPCDDGIGCTIDLCDATADGGCAHRLDHPVCDDGNSETADACTAATGCASVFIPDDGDACTLDACDPASGACTHTPITCWDTDVCTSNVCDPATGCPANATPCVDDGLYCNGEESCDPKQGCIHSGTPCLPNWQCDEATDSCTSEFWTNFWQFPNADPSCTMVPLPLGPSAQPDATEWDLEARCHGTIVGVGRLTDLSTLSTRHGDWAQPPTPGSPSSLTLSTAAAALVNSATDTRFVDGVMGEYSIMGEADPHRELVVLGESASLSDAAREGKHSAAGFVSASKAPPTTCQPLFPPPSTVDDCEAAAQSCRDDAYSEYYYNTGVCAGALLPTLVTCLELCAPFPAAWEACAIGCGVPLAIIAGCQAYYQHELNEDLKDCATCDDFCHCEYFLERCPVTGNVGYKIVGLCPGEHVEMTGRCWRKNRERPFERDVAYGSAYYATEVVEQKCPAGAEWEVFSGPVVSSADPNQPPRSCTAQSFDHGTVAANGHHVPTFACFDLSDPNQESCAGSWVIKGLVSSDVNLIQGVFVDLHAPGMMKTVYPNPTGHPAFEFPPLPAGTNFRLATGSYPYFANAKCFFEENHNNVLEGQMPNADRTVLIHCTDKTGFPVQVVPQVEANPENPNQDVGDPGRIDVLFLPENDVSELGSAHVGNVITFGPVPDGTEYKLEVTSPPYFNRNMECHFDNGLQEIEGSVTGRPSLHNLVCGCVENPTEGNAKQCYADPNDPDENDVWPWPPCTLCCEQSCGPDSGIGDNCYPCPCDDQPGVECWCCDVVGQPCPITCEQQNAGWGPSTTTTLQVPRENGTPAPSRATADTYLAVNVNAQGEHGIRSIHLFIDHVLVDQVDLHTSTSPVSSGSRTLDTSGLAEGLHTLGVWAWEDRPEGSAPRHVQVPFIVSHDTTVPACGGDTMPPAVHVSSPVTGAQLSTGKVKVEAIASDASGIKKVEFLVDGSTVPGTADHVFPYAFAWSATAGQHTLSARAYDTCDHPSLSAPVTVNVGPDPCANDHAGPGLVLLSPLSGSSHSTGPVEIAADAQDASGVKAVEFYVDEEPPSSDATDPYMLSETFTTGGPHSIRAHALDACNNDSWSDTISINVSAPPFPCASDHTPPAVAIVSPADDATVARGQLTIALSASDNLGVNAAAFEIDGKVPASAVDLSAPFAYVFTPSKMSHTVRAHAVDHCGNEAWSAPVTVYLANQNPVAVPDSAQVSKGGTVTIFVLGNDSDPDGDVIHLPQDAVIVPPVHGTATRVSSGTIKYTPDSGFPATGSATDQFRYRIVDAYGKVHSAIVTVSVNP
ncbi:MAG: LamG-like jellyroll fold domain-containing protein [Candidatus Polarisedimenticolia bacterium]